jgi:hypothetical protein
MMKRWKRFAAILFTFVLLLFGRLQQGKAESNSWNTSQEQPRQNEHPAALSQVTLPIGTTISIRIADEVNSNHNHSGDLITGTVDPSVFIADHVVIPRGTEAHVRLTENRKGGRLHGKADVRLELVGLVMNQEKVDVDSDEYRKKQGALGAKVKGMAAPTASAGASAATSPTPGAGAVAPIIAVFRAAKIEVHAGTRIPFKLESAFTFDAPVEPPTGFESDKR